MRLLIKTSALAFLLIFYVNKVSAQVCAGDLGLPIRNIDFGSGASQFGASISETSYIYVAGNPNDGQYTIVKSTTGLNPGWHQNIINRTPNDPNGYMMLVNADEKTGIFYQTSVTGLCPNTTYEFAAWIINILRNPGIKPNVKFTIQNNGSTVKDFVTGDIPEGSATDWKRYGFTFKTPADVGVITLIMTNENPGGNGNDLALDDITFSPCGPKITPTIVGSSSDKADLCVGDTKNVELSATVTQAYTNPTYQWQVNRGTGYVNLTGPGAQSQRVIVPFTNAVAGTYSYQLLVAEQGSINSPNCRIVSSPLRVIVNDNPVPIASYTGTACEGTDVTLSVNTGTSFRWTGPNGFTSDLQSPVINNLTPSQSGLYTVSATNASGCTTNSSVRLNVLPKIVIGTNLANNVASVCEDGSLQLMASGGTSYQWSPVEGLSNPSISNPIVTPKSNTVYTLTVSNGNCSTTQSITINVTKKPSADAGADQKALFGQSVNLHGTADGEGVSYLWSPSDYLDDPTKLNPVASPPKSMTYTLTVRSNCGVDTDEVFVQVYPKIEIPNTFTPNGDGRNDTWNVEALSAFPNHEVKIVNRNGQLVFRNKGNYHPWDGKFNNKETAAGTYYYTIYLNDDFKMMSGWIFLVR
ncbi:MAG: T9SS type B sorting domain-containing protein [Pedobacter sp.]|nr:MAG: T9SS type B sorting domain-containing protein [Pedobacter sp.]